VEAVVVSRATCRARPDRYRAGRQPESMRVGRPPTDDPRDPQDL